MTAAPRHVLQAIRSACRATRLLARQERDEARFARLVYGAVYAGGWRTGGAWRGLDVRLWSACTLEFFSRLQLAAGPPDILRGWSIEKHQGETVRLKNGAIEGICNSKALRHTVDGAGVAVSAVRLLLPGFAVRECNPGGADLTVRLYLSINPEHAEWLIGGIGQRFVHLGIPYQMKVLANPFAYWRHDAGVVYVPAESADHAATVLMREAMKLAVPMRRCRLFLTKPLHPSIRIAHQPVDGSSHGQWVSRLLIEAYRKTTTEAEMEEAFHAAIEASGRTLRAPWARSDLLARAR